jgi:TRAP-type C4-dicarboxylate transport system permease small subunit
MINMHNTHPAGPSSARRPSAFLRWALRIPELFTATLIAILVAFLTISVVSRYALDIGLVWSDEAARLLFVWIVFVGFAVGVRHRAHIGVEWLVDALPSGLKRALGVLQDILILLFSIFFTWQSIVTVRFSFLQTLPGLQISIAWLYIAVLVAGVLMTLYAVANLWDRLSGSSVGSDAIGEDAARHAE